jgi:hypothetical protein
MLVAICIGSPQVYVIAIALLSIEIVAVIVPVSLKVCTPAALLSAASLSFGTLTISSCCRLNARSSRCSAYF